MIRLKLSHIVFTFFLYHIKIVFSILLDLNNIDGSGFNIIKIFENKVTKKLIYSTPDRKITEVHQGRKLIWTGNPGEHIKCLTIYTFTSSSKILISIEIENPKYDSMKFIYMHSYRFKYVTQRYFESAYALYSKPLKPMASKPIPGKIPIPRLKPPEKRKADTDYTEGPKKKPTVEPQPQSEQLEPEVIQVEVESDEDDDDDLLVVSANETVDLYSETVDTTTDTSTDPKELPIKILTQIRYTQTETHQSQDLDTQTDIHETKNTETQTDIHETVDVGIQTKLRTRYPKKQDVVKTTSVQTQTEVIDSIDQEIVDEGSEAEIIPVLIGSDGEYEELSMFPEDDDSDSEIELQISSDSDMDVDELTDRQIIQSDAVTQTDTDKGPRDPSTLPLKKRPYKPE